MKTITINQIMSWDPCYDLVAKGVLPEGWEGTALDILSLEIPAADKLWAVLREECLSDKTLRLFACLCAREALSLIPNPDPRSLEAIEVAERFTLGLATEEELEAAKKAGGISRVAAWATARAAAWAAARAAARAADVAAAAGEAAERAAAWVEARATARATWTTEREVKENQVYMLIQLIKEEE